MVTFYEASNLKLKKYYFHSMKYISTRGKISPISFKEAVMMGLATDGGLLLPENLPTVDSATVQNWKSCTFQELALEIFKFFITDIPADDLKDIN